jgi:predicted NBD/HSP70 family sugar kinase
MGLNFDNISFDNFISYIILVDMLRKTHNLNTGLPGLARQTNLETVIRLMRRMEFFSKIDLVRECGISTTTMSKLFRQLENDNIIRQSSRTDKSFGRPKTLYQLCPDIQVAGIVIDVDTTTICFSSLQGETDPKRMIELPTGEDPERLLANIKAEFLFLEKSLNAHCRLVGVCIPGLIESRSGRSVLNPNLHWLEGMCPAREIGRMVGAPAIVMHEERALCRAQMQTVDIVRDYVTMDFSVGVGMSVVVDGRHLSGSTGFAGEIGHIVMEPDGRQCGCGNRGCLETIASDRVFQAEMNLPLDQALKKLAGGDADAVERATAVLEAQAKGVAAVVNIFNPERIFVYSRLSEAYPDYIARLRADVEKLSIPFSFSATKIETAQAGKLKGTLMLTVDKLAARAALRKTSDKGPERSPAAFPSDDLTA